MQTKITFQGGRISLGTFHHENMHQWWGDNVSEDTYNLTFFKEGYADMSRGLQHGAHRRPTPPAASARRPVTRRSRRGWSTIFNTLLQRHRRPAPGASRRRTRRTTNLLRRQPRTRGRASPTSRCARSSARTTSPRPTRRSRRKYGGGSITEAQMIASLHKYLPNQSAGCHAKLDAFFKQWWDTAYTGPPAPGNKPRITGPGPGRPGLLRHRRRLLGLRRVATSARRSPRR